VFGSNRNGVYDLFEKPMSGSGIEEPLLVTPEEKRLLSWSSDGRFLLYVANVAVGRDLWALPLDGERKPFPVVETTFDEDEGQFSPDGHWIAYGSTESGRHEIYVQPFPGPGERSRVSTAGGSQVRWRPDGKELYYVGPDGLMMAVSIQVARGGQTLQATAPRALFPTRFAIGANVTGTKPQYAVASDGRFLMNIRIEDQAAKPITITQNWTSLLPD
jgi:Tol biopolymer transport system component